MTKKLHIVVSKEIKQKLDEIKEKEGASLNWTVNRAILNYLRLKKKVKKPLDKNKLI